MPWANRHTKAIPTIHSSEKSLELNDYSSGMNSFVGGDVMKPKFLRLAKNGRITTLGEYETRKGFDFHSDAAGETQDQAQTSTTGAANQAFNETTRLAQVFTTSSAGRCSKVEINIQNPNSASGVVLVELWSDSSGAPGTFLARSSISSSDVPETYDYMTARFPNAPVLEDATDYWIIVYVQSTGTGSFELSSTTTASTALSSSDSGSSWSTTAFALNFKQYYAPINGAKGIHRAYKSDGTSKTLIAHGTTLYSVDDVTGALTSIKTGLNASATDYRFETVNDVVYYVNGFDGYRKWDFTTESQVNTTNYTNITEHKGLMFLLQKDDPNKLDFSNFADYETFTSTDFLYIPSPKTGDPVTAMLSLNGFLLFWTRRNKYILSGSDNATFALDEAPDQKGTFSQETVTADKNFAYYLSDDGIYRTNGSEPQLLSTNIYQDVLALNSKDKAVVQQNKGRLYVWFPSAGSSVNDNCYVLNLNYGDGHQTVESLDTNAYICRSFSATNDDDALLVASSVIGQVYWQELESNDFTNLGGDIDFELQTHYSPFDAPAVNKQVRFWLPRFEAQSGNYTIACEYATERRNNWQLVSGGNLSVQGEGALWGSATWGAFTWGTTAEVQGNFYIPGEYKRIAVRYKHYATRQPQKFLGHTFVTQTRRLR